jgi:hypothetical protein
VQQAPFEPVLQRGELLYRSGDTLGGSLLGAGDFEETAAGWVGQGGTLTREYRAELGSTALAFVNDTTQYYSRCISPGPLPLRKGALYRLRFSLSSAQGQRVDVFVANRTSAFGDGQLVTPLASYISSPWGQSYDMLFEPDSVGEALYLHFRLHKSDQPLYLDGVSLHEVARGTVVQPQEQAMLFVNASGGDSALALTGVWRTLEGVAVSSPLLLKAHEGVVLYRDGGASAVIDRGGAVAMAPRMVRVQRTRGRGVQLQGLEQSDVGARVRLLTLDGRVVHQCVVTAQMARQGSVVLQGGAAAGVVIVELGGGAARGRAQRAMALLR